ncbi:hypothetical protein JW978_02190 [Candidatus Dojkabacteria bacterium]|nr:hypothetical protein [Candidatus Dojkabacteria bacterium]
MKKILLVVLLITTVATSFLTFATDAEAVVVDETSDYTLTESTVPESAAGDYLLDSTTMCDPDTQVCNEEITGIGVKMVELGLKFLVKRKSNVIDSNTGELLLDDNGEPITFYKPGAIQSIVGLNAQLYANPPASGITYAQNEWSKLTTGNTAYAAPEDSWIYYPGLGFEILNPIADYWAVSRNIAYAAMIIIIIIVALMVLFRSSFGGQTQVTIANSIPNIVIALIMITLSYALSGLAIDFITIGTNVTQQVLVQNTWSPGYDLWNATSITTHPIDPLNAPIETLRQVVSDATPDALGLNQEEYNGLIDQLVDATDQDKLEILENVPAFKADLEYNPTLGDANNPVKYHLQPDDDAMSVWGVFGTANIRVNEGSIALDKVVPDNDQTNNTVVNALDRILEAADAAGADKLIGLLFTLVLAIAAFMASIKLFMKLVSKYLVLALYPIVSPFIMLTIAIPGQGMKAVTNYFRTLFAASLTFVAVYAIFLFMIVLTNDLNFGINFGYSPSLIGANTARLVGDGGAVSGQFIKNLIAFGLFISTPMIPDFLEKAIATPAEFKKEQAKTVFAGSLRSGLASGTQPLYKVAKGRYDAWTDRPKAKQQ